MKRINECPFVTFEGLSTNFEASRNVFYNVGLTLLQMFALYIQILPTKIFFSINQAVRYIHK